MAQQASAAPACPSGELAAHAMHATGACTLACSADGCMVPCRAASHGRGRCGAPQVARIETEKLLLHLLEAELEARRRRGSFAGKFAGLTHYFGYEGRCSLPTNFDATCVPYSPQLHITWDWVNPGPAHAACHDKWTNPRCFMQVEDSVPVGPLWWRQCHAGTSVAQGPATLAEAAACGPCCRPWDHMRAGELRCRYCAALGYAAGALVGAGRTGLMATCSALERPATDWAIGGFPLVSMMCVERRKGRRVAPLPRPALNQPSFYCTRSEHSSQAVQHV